MAAAIRLSQQHSCSLDQLVGACEQCRRNFEAERLDGFQIDHQFVLGRRLHGQIGRLLALQDAVNVAGGALSALTSSRHSMPISSLPYTYSCRQRAEQGLGLLQIERVEAFSKPIMDRSEKIEGLVPLSLIAQKTCHA
jgi:hypothetical protein